MRKILAIGWVLLVCLGTGCASIRIPTIPGL
jgi:hypothetical protein